MDNTIGYQQWCPVEYLSTVSELARSCGTLAKFLSIAFTLVRVNSESKQVGQ